MSTKLSLIAAVAQQGVIGRHNALPWHLPEDLQHFKAITLGTPVIMGRKTWESLPEKFRPLPGRRNVVISRHRNYLAPGACVLDSLEKALEICADAPETFVIGGAELYQQAMSFAQRLVITEIALSIEGDAFFPVIDPQCWAEKSRQTHTSIGGLNFAFIDYIRR